MTQPQLPAPAIHPLMHTISRARNWVVCLAIVISTALVYRSVWQFDFVNFDDEDYVYSNPHVLQGLNSRTIGWAFTTGDAANYHPLTWISLALDVSVFGLRPGCMHVENLLLHICNALLLFVLLKKATNSHWASAFCALVFALHPTHVESVAWISERKDTLSTFFLFIAMILYVRYTRRGGGWIYGWLLISFTLSLLAKQMGVTLPVILLLLDYWPLHRGSLGWKKRIVEKVPLLMLSLAAAVATFIAQHAGGAVATAVGLPITYRLRSFPVAYLLYISKTLWPINLCAFYPYHADWSLLQDLSCVAVLLIISIVVVLRRKKRPQLFVGWFWFTIMLLPVSGLVQIGSAIIADRYLYVPSVGICIMLAWSVSPSRRWVYLNSMLALGVIVTLGVASSLQVGYWRNTRTLFTRSLSIINDGAFAHMQLGRLYLTEHDPISAKKEYEQAAQLAPDDFTPQYDLGNLSLANPPEAIAHYQRALALSPHNARVENNLAIALINAHQPDLAATALRHAIADDPLYIDAHLNLATLLESTGSTAAALSEYQAALKLDNQNARARAGVQRLTSR